MAQASLGCTPSLKQKASSLTLTSQEREERTSQPDLRLRVVVVRVFTPANMVPNAGQNAYAHGPPQAEDGDAEQEAAEGAAHQPPEPDPQGDAWLQ